MKASILKTITKSRVPQIILVPTSQGFTLYTSRHETVQLHDCWRNTPDGISGSEEVVLPPISSLQQELAFRRASVTLLVPDQMLQAVAEGLPGVPANRLLEAARTQADFLFSNENNPLVSYEAVQGTDSTGGAIVAYALDEQKVLEYKATVEKESQWRVDSVLPASAVLSKLGPQDTGLNIYVAESGRQLKFEVKIGAVLLTQSVRHMPSAPTPQQFEDHIRGEVHRLLGGLHASNLPCPNVTVSLASRNSTLCQLREALDSTLSDQLKCIVREHEVPFIDGGALAADKQQILQDVVFSYRATPLNFLSKHHEGIRQQRRELKLRKTILAIASLVLLCVADYYLGRFALLSRHALIAAKHAEVQLKNKELSEGLDEVKFIDDWRQQSLTVSGTLEDISEYKRKELLFRSVKISRKSKNGVIVVSLTGQARQMSNVIALSNQIRSRGLFDQSPYRILPELSQSDFPIRFELQLNSKQSSTAMNIADRLPRMVGASIQN